GKRLASGSDDGVLQVWAFAEGKELCRWPGHQGQVKAVAFSPDGSTLASGGSLVDCTVALCEPDTARQQRRWPAHEGAKNEARERGEITRPRRGVAWMGYSPDGRSLASAGGDGAVRLWDAATGNETSCLNGHRDRVHCVAFSPDGSLLASAGADRAIFLWDVALRVRDGRLERIALKAEQ